jgi:hypothetical protein
VDKIKIANYRPISWLISFSKDFGNTNV